MVFSCSISAKSASIQLVISLFLLFAVEVKLVVRIWGFLFSRVSSASDYFFFLSN